MQLYRVVQPSSVRGRLEALHSGGVVALPNLVRRAAASAARPSADRRDRNRTTSSCVLDAAAVLFGGVEIDVKDLPLDAVGIDHPEFTLVRVAAIDVEFFANGDTGCFNAPQVRQNRLIGFHLNSEMAHHPVVRTNHDAPARWRD